MAVVKYWFPTAISLALLLVVQPGVARPESDLAPTAPAQQQAALRGTPTADLSARLQALDGVIAEFTQQIVSPRGVMLEQSAGTLYLRKPDFRWDVQAPYPQTILARGDQVEVFDPDLEQVTQRTLDNAVDQAPLALLTAPDLNLDKHFSVVELGDEEGWSRFELYPVGRDSLFQRMRLEFAGPHLRALTIFDHVGQQTRIRFADYRLGQVVQSGTFELEYPPGTDFVRG